MVKQYQVKIYRLMNSAIICTLSLMYLPAVATVHASEADVVDVEIIAEGNDRYTFNVTVRHDDTGWDHYANRWEILNQKGEIIAVRPLRHPHVKQQSFTRSLPFVPVHQDTGAVSVRAHCSTDGFTGKEVVVNIPGK